MAFLNVVRTEAGVPAVCDCIKQEQAKRVSGVRSLGLRQQKMASRCEWTDLIGELERDRAADGVVGEGSDDRLLPARLQS